MFVVIHKDSGAIRQVYGWNGQYFLVWDETLDRWAYVPMHEYRPYER